MNKVPSLERIRDDITTLDRDLLALLAKRRQLSLEVARSKEVDIRPIRDTQREKELLARLVRQGREQGLDAHYVISLYQAIIEDSVLNQQAYLQGRANPETQKQQYCIAYLGARGSYSYLAASRYCQRRQVEMQDLGCQNFDDIVQAVESGHADYGFLPIENTSSGSINEVYDVLQHTSLAIVGETTIEVGHCLLAKAGSKLADIKTVYAHPQPISQCSRYLSRHPDFRLEYCASSAEAMEKVLQGDNTVAAIGSSEGGALYQLEPLEQELANQKINQSRFIVVARKAIEVPEQLPAKTTLIMATGQKPGALVEALLILKDHNLNMSKLESRPIPGTPWEEMFYLDVDANLASIAMQQALAELERLTRFIKVLGCYPCETVEPTQLSHSQLLIEPESSRQDSAKPSPQRHSRHYKPASTEISCGQLKLGQGQFAALAQLNLPIDAASFAPSAKALREAGFQGVVLSTLTRQPNAKQQLPKLQSLLNQAGLQSIVTLEHAEDLALAQTAADMLLLSGKQMYNTELLNALGGQNLPVILERNPMACQQDWLASADTLLAGGNQQLILCDAGVSGLNQPEQLVLDLAALVELKTQSHLPLLVNPSLCLSPSSSEQTLTAQALAIKALGVDGLIIAVDVRHPQQHAGLIAKLYQTA